MKKYLLLLLCLFLVVGCSNNKEEKKDIKEDIKEEVSSNEEVIQKEIYKDDNPVIVGLYQKGKLVKDIDVNIMDSTDIISLDVYFTNIEDVGSSNTKTNFNKYASNYKDINNYKIGFIVSFTTEDKEFNKVITSPKDMYILSPYIYNYLYDDIHQDGSWYSHVEEKDVNDETIYSSIKLYGAEYTNKINSPITLTVFTYDTEDDFDSNGMYRGNSKYSVTLKR